MNNLVAASIWDCDIGYATKYIYTLRLHYPGDIIFFVYNLNGDVRNFLKANNIQMIEVQNDTGWKPAMSRFHWYRDFLRKHSYEHILFTDVRDVLFQSDPFTREVNGINLYLEEKIIKDCPMNPVWLDFIIGPDVRQQIHDNHITCAGTIKGDYLSILQYLDVMLDTLENEVKSRVGKTFDVSDQALQNYCLWTNKFDKPNIRKNGFSDVLTMGYMTDEQVIYNSDRKVYNYDGTLPSILHQYDRRNKFAL